MDTYTRDLIIRGTALIAFMSAGEIIGFNCGGDVGLLIGQVLGCIVSIGIAQIAITWIDIEQGD